MSSTLTNLLYHIVFSTKNRMNLIDSQLRSHLYPYLGGIVRGEKGSVLKINGTSNHVHILLKMPATIPLSEIMRRIKGNSSRWVNMQSRPRSRFAWQRGYAAFSVSESAVGNVSQYIDNQAAHHKTRSFKEELLLLLRKHGISYDERHIWE